jgi:hypothetical protein
MKNIFIHILFSLLLLTIACKENSTQAANQSGLVGKWLWKQTTGGIAPRTFYPAGNNIYLLQITKDNNFIESRNDTVTFSDYFIIYIDTTYKEQIIDFTNSNRNNIEVNKVSSDSLTLWDGMFDGYFSFYTRVK